ncbi:hypothetical protein IC229_30015 [Spirosoma sp. BT702]|uniref:Uncharacterized protein n=1 Tax=Spirosoma profusum TaxID=2771354 RepID=A0A927AV09_9BACT|nr:hypothetical protein [Spirosoma profusum]MBD2704906.1 hypothetical protein [Spirosoma profusum]
MKIVTNLLLSTVFTLGLFVSTFAQKPDSSKTRQPQVPNSVTAQRNAFEGISSMNQIIGSGVYTMVATIDQRYEGLHGTAYFLPEWNTGQVEIASGQHYRNVPIKFNAYKQQLILLRKQVNNDSIIVDANQVKSFQFTDNLGQLYVFRRYPNVKTDETKAKEGYFLVLYQGKSSLLKRISKTFQPANFKGPYSNDIRYDEFQNVISYYLLKPDQTLSKIKLSDKALLEAIGDHKDELKDFARQSSLNLKTEEGAAALLKRYDSL